jgi:hypothetical protein
MAARRYIALLGWFNLFRLFTPFGAFLTGA